MLCAAVLWVVFLPEAGCALAEHSSPVLAHLFCHLGLLAHLAKCLKLVETHVGSGDSLHLGVEHHALHHGLTVFVAQVAVDHGEHVGELCYLAVHLAVLDGVHERLAAVVPECGLQLVAQSLCQLMVTLCLCGVFLCGDATLRRVFLHVVAQQRRAQLHGLQRLAHQNLLEAQSAALVHGEVHPVHENPVVGLAFCHSVGVGAAQHVLHHGLHPRVYLAHKGDVAGVHVVVVNRLKPVERVVHDGVDVRRHGVLAPELADGALHAFGVEPQVVVHQIRLYGIARPCPAVALYAVNEELAGGEVHGVGTHLPYPVQQVVAAAETAAALGVERSVLVVHCQVAVAQVAVDFHINVAEGFRHLCHYLL